MKYKQAIGNKTLYTSGKSIAYNGALISVAIVFAYSLSVLIYTIIRTSITIGAIFPKGNRNLILLVNAFSVAYSVAFFSILIAAISSITGIVAAIILETLLKYFNPSCNVKKAILISMLAGFAMVTNSLILFQALLKDKMTFIYPETFLFWFLFPAIIFFIICILGGCKINKILKTT